jgi:hypothetical protein
LVRILRAEKKHADIRRFGAISLFRDDCRAKPVCAGETSDRAFAREFQQDMLTPESRNICFETVHSEWTRPGRHTHDLPTIDSHNAVPCRLRDVHHPILAPEPELSGFGQTANQHARSPDVIEEAISLVGAQIPPALARRPGAALPREIIPASRNTRH